jgi:hypothetical protein
MTKYMVKTWEIDSQKGWNRVQALHPGIRHYRYTRGWALTPPTVRSDDWELRAEPVPRAIEGEYVPVSTFDQVVAARRKILAMTPADVKGFNAGTPASGPQVGPLTGAEPPYWI